MKTMALIMAGGEGERFGGDVPREFLQIAGKPLLSWTIGRFEAAASIDQVVIVTGEDFLLHVNNTVVNPYGFKKVFKIIPGGPTRVASVMKGLEALPLATDFAAIHDGVRPLVRPDDIDRVVKTAQEHRAAILGSPISEAVKRVRGDMIMASLDRDSLYRAETPQVFQYDLIKEAYRSGMAKGLDGLDDAAVVESYGFKIKVVRSSAPNIRLSTAGDLKYMRTLLEGEQA